MTACDRINYTEEVLKSLAGCIGIEDYIFLPHVEPINKEVIKALGAFSACETTVTVNERRLGHTLNTHTALKNGFSKGDYVILIEDDTLLSQDFLLFHEFCSNKFKGDKNVFTVCAGHYRRPDEKINPEDYFSFERQHRFSNQGWGTWSDRWNEDGGMSSTWENPELILGSIYQVQYKYGGWDSLLNKHLRRGRCEIIPTMSRVQNIGAIGGVHSISPDEHFKRIRVKDWAGEYKFSNNEFHPHNLQQA